MQARGLLNYFFKYCWPKVIYCICQPNELENELKKKLGGTSRAPSKNLGGAWATQAPLRIATACRAATCWLFGGSKMIVYLTIEKSIGAWCFQIACETFAGDHVPGCGPAQMNWAYVSPPFVLLCDKNTKMHKAFVIGVSRSVRFTG